MLGGVALFLGEGGSIDNEILGGVVEAHLRCDELFEIFVDADEVDIDVVVGQLIGDGGHHVVGFEGGYLDDGDAHGLDNGDDAFFLGREVFGRRLAVGFVLRVDVSAKDGFVADVHGHREVVGFALSNEIEEHAAEGVDRLGGFACGRGEGSEGGVVCPVDLVVSVEHVKGTVHGDLSIGCLING